MNKISLLIFALFVSQQTHASLLSFTAFSGVDDPVYGFFDGYQDYSGVPAGCCSTLEANVLINTDSTVSTVATNYLGQLESYTYTYENAATIIAGAGGGAGPNTFLDVDVVMTHSIYNSLTVSFSDSIVTGIDDSLTYNSSFSLRIADYFNDYGALGELDSDSLLSSILARETGEHLGYGESQYSLDPSCTYNCNKGFYAQNGGGVSLTPLQTTVVPIPGTFVLLATGLVSLLSFCKIRGRRKFV